MFFLDFVINCSKWMYFIVVFFDFYNFCVNMYMMLKSGLIVKFLCSIWFFVDCVVYFERFLVLNS